MDEILQFIAIEAVRTRDGIRTTITFTPAAIDLIKEAYGVDKEQIDEMISVTIEQNKVVWDSLDEDDKDFLVDSIVDQVACEQFAIEEMGIEDYITMMHTSGTDGEVQIVVITKQEIGFV